MKTIKNFILTGSYSEADKLLRNLEITEAGSNIFQLACDTENLSAYSFVINQLLNHQGTYWHYVVAEMFLVPFCFVEGGYALGLYHIRKAIELEPQNIKYKQLLLAFHDLPEPLVCKEEAISVAKEIIAANPTIKKAIRILEGYGIKP